MRFVYLAPAVLGLLLAGCGPEDHTDEVPPPAPSTHQPAAPAAPVEPSSVPPAEPGSGTMEGPHSGDKSGTVR
ncbi:hypothetical protein FHR87_001110 [Azomonas macrocytogenes]|uniref:Lipoprotein n=1 Tax=Azomonas macrocytogenes TaxID=69962 RepID=A0A839SZZ0_AZOMA|nr:hypothetical protein [Azomonas macrocytogenes]